MKKSIVPIALLLFAICSCSKEKTGSNTTTNNTITKAYLVTQAQSYDASGTLFTTTTYYRSSNSSGPQLDSVVGVTPSTNTITVDRYYYNVPLVGLVSHYTNGVRTSADDDVVYFDAYGNVTKDENWNQSGVKQSYTSYTYTH
jgi:hypothetical protein